MGRPIGWRRAGVYLLVSDLVPTDRLLPDRMHDEAQARLYDWIAEELGPHTPVLQGHMHASLRTDALLACAGDDAARYWARFDASKRRARAAGLHYAHSSHADERIACHACGGLLLQLRRGPCVSQPCLMRFTWCTCWSHEQHATGGRCDHCGAAVPIVTLTTDELTETRRPVRAVLAAGRDLPRGGAP